MKTVYLFSNFSNNAGFTKEILRYIKRDLLDYSSLVFISSSPIGYEKSGFYFNVNKNWFNIIGIKFKEYYLIDNRTDKKTSLDILNNASCIFLMGGQTREQIKYIKENDFVELLQKYNGIVMGISAGAINLAVKPISFGHSENEEETIIYDGIGLTEKIIYPHFEINGKMVNEIKKYSLNYCIYGLCDYSAIIEKDNKTELIGDIYKIENNTVEKIS
jgi:peptidase E